MTFFNIKHRLQCFIYGHKHLMTYKDFSTPQNKIVKLECWYCNKTVWKSRRILS